LIGTVTLIHLLAVISPGPDLVMVIRNSILHSRSLGVFTAVGLGLGIAVHVAYCIAGVAVLVSKSLLLFNAIKYLGAAYLVYIGIRSLLSRSELVAIELATKNTEVHTPLKAVKQGFLTNILNPKVTLFFLSVFTVVISPGTPPIVLAAIALIVIVNTILWFTIVAVCMSHAWVRKRFESSQTTISKAFGGILTALGLKIALSE
jgi:RhtB (resistance to homoserine/threonine) family protein